MNQYSSKIEANSKIIHTLTGLYMHEFVNRNKTKIAEGKCLILQSNDFSETGPHIFLRMNNFDFCKQINSSLFVRMVYAKSTSFLFYNQFKDDVIYAISAGNNATDLALLSQILVKQGNVIDYQSPSLKYQNKIRIDYHVQNLAENQVIINFSKTAKAAKFIGKFFGKINKAIGKKSDDINKAFDKKIEKVRQESFSESTRDKWSSFKKTASGMNEKVSNALKPIGEKVQKLTGSLGASYYTSTNKYIKSFREFTSQTQKSINEGYRAEDKTVSICQPSLLTDNYQQMTANKQKLINETKPSPTL